MCFYQRIRRKGGTGHKWFRQLKYHILFITFHQQGKEANKNKKEKKGKYVWTTGNQPVKIALGRKEVEKYVENWIRSKLASARWYESGNTIVTSEQILSTTLQKQVESRRPAKSEGCARPSNNRKNCISGNYHSGNVTSDSSTIIE